MAGVYLDSAALAARNAAREQDEARTTRRRKMAQFLNETDLPQEFFEFHQERRSVEETAQDTMQRSENELSQILAEAGREEARRRAAQGKGGPA